ncbi:hypothetical protein [Liquorilactobacillus satsumensis]|uniref:hypothetical protein n=1 Tax=Liquorilactobacillus satsumensis TaxID=259059 RepID=UPI000704CC6C|nr:hypothetical protein [Liquorilactobacillus satsumensis]MCC7666071.1 hypothetical protein [Liquorilactobacillus satsumensis]MCP9328828.1 hypothetical protein [Liquorilactobacillus satsumensis]MCP9356822.1 hypothetical protein [Liquorilactobacillus satsumensis]MCP9370762.1 hypothetical protein [Liquorilactobacillus satsumensis]
MITKTKLWIHASPFLIVCSIFLLPLLFLTIWAFMAQNLFWIISLVLFDFIYLNLESTLLAFVLFKRKQRREAEKEATEDDEK